jgi:homoserine dehydrogenase
LGGRMLPAHHIARVGGTRLAFLAVTRIDPAAVSSTVESGLDESGLDESGADASGRILPRTVRVGLLGCGNVGASLVQLVAERAETIAARTGVRLEIVRVAVRNVSRDREVELAEGVLTRDARAVVADPEVDVVVEVIGGIEPARELILAALTAGKPVVTANKELLANVGTELFAVADAHEVDLLFEAAVAGGIPLVRALRESLRGEPIRRVLGIVNGTTNYILTKMSEEGADYGEALAEAQRLGYAERDPTADVEGFDAGAKAAIIASICFGAKVVAGDVYHEGISGLTAGDIDMAKRLGYVVKLLAIVEQDAESTEIAVRVHPALVPLHHPLASVRESYNAVFVEGEAAGSLMFYGRGAGGAPTASAVLGDLIDAALNLVKGTHGTAGVFADVPIRAIDDTSSEYLLALEVADEPGVLHSVTGIFARHEVSIRAAEQEGIGPDARLVFITHGAREADVQATVKELRELDVVRRVGGLLRVIAG